jgi:hypothetical protein
MGEESVMQMYSVYVLTDPTDDDAVFYVGVTSDLKERMRQHDCIRYHGNTSFDRICQIREHGLKFGHRVVYQGHDKKLARLKERELILTLPGLVNSKSPCGMTSEFTKA